MAAIDRAGGGEEVLLVYFEGRNFNVLTKAAAVKEGVLKLTDSFDFIDEFVLKTMNLYWIL